MNKNCYGLTRWQQTQTNKYSEMCDWFLGYLITVFQALRLWMKRVDNLQSNMHLGGGSHCLNKDTVSAFTSRDLRKQQEQKL